MPEVLMVPPHHFTVNYEINPWMNRSVPTSPAIAQAQWDALYRILRDETGAAVLLADPQPGLPDMVFTANAGLVRGGRVVLSNFRHPERQGEAAHFSQWFSQHGFEVILLPPDRYFEGEGDALFFGDSLIAGYRWRSDVHSHRMVGEQFEVRVLSLELSQAHYYHLDTCFCPLDEKTAAYFPGAFDHYGRTVLENEIPDLIEVDAGEAARFACNAVVLGRSVVLNSGCPRFESALAARGFQPHSTPLDEFLKAGGAAKCLTLYLDR